MKKQIRFEHNLYTTWKTMRRRCFCKNHNDFKGYGAKGITIDDRWSDFWKFVEDMGDRPFGMTLDRIDNLKGYSKQNCRWATHKQQSDNRRISYECAKGHPWTEETTIHTHNGKNKTRRCKICFIKRTSK